MKYTGTTLDYCPGKEMYKNYQSQPTRIYNLLLEIRGQFMLVSQVLRESFLLQYIYTFHLYIHNNASIADP